MIEDGLYTFMAADATLAAIVSDRIYPIRMPDDLATFPAVTYQRVSGGREVAHDGDAALTRPRFQISVWGQGYKEVRQATQAVLDLFSGYKGAIGDHTDCACFIETDLEVYEEQTKLIHAIVDVTIWHKD
jgi:hypothetical protein